MQLIRYNLDSLGWFQFEWLVQALLKAELGSGVESWGGTGDWGRDAYAEGPLPFPARDTPSKGPFIFQAKFVNGANAAGADSATTLLEAVRREAKRIRERITGNQRKEPLQYGLLTNAPTPAKLRTEIKQILEKNTAAAVTVLGGNDICDLLDNRPSITRSFPQLLSLRNLSDVIEAIVNREAVNRSTAAIAAAKSVIPVFVPTAAYDRTWSVLAKHSFAVLEGPPEMGKTAIAWMIAIAQLANDWDAIACDEPAHLFAAHKPDASQVFVADDTFGRTEYDTTLGAKWERQLERVLAILDDRHWLIWTSRKHILERARREMDVQGKAATLPDTAAVLVNAGHLKPLEKALILYRHARAASLDVVAKKVLKWNVHFIVGDSAFTPERIRRFVQDSLPKLVTAKKSGKLNDPMIRQQIHAAIRNPTDRMIKSFRALPLEHKWLLVGLLEQGHSPSLANLKRVYRRLLPDKEQVDFAQIIEELSEAFIRYD